jgi:hypothetical protein
MNTKTIVIFDNPNDLEKLLELNKNKNIIIISINYPAHKKLEDNSIPHTISDTFLTDIERNNLQSKSYKLSNWYENPEIMKNLIYEGVNLGSLIKAEFINILINFLKKFIEFHKISLYYPDAFFYCSNTSINIIKNFTQNVSLLNSNRLVPDFSPLDSLKTVYKIGFKNHSYDIKLSKKTFTKLKSFSEKTSNLLIKKNNLKKNSKCILFSEFNTLNFQKFLIENKSPFVVYNRRKPAIWNKKTISLIKNSEAMIENENSLSSESLKNISFTLTQSFEKSLDELFSNDDIFSKIFTFDNMIFWHLLKSDFIKLFKNRVSENIYEIELAKKLFKKYNFSGIMLNSVVGPNEQILFQLGKIQKIPIFLNQHGLIFDTEEAYEHNVHMGGVISSNVDLSLVWGKIDHQYRQECGIEKDKIIEIGCTAFDNIEQTEPEIMEKNYVVLATQSPTEENIFDLTTDTIKKNIYTIQYVCKLLTKLNLDLIIKPHPDPNEFDPTQIAKDINPNIRIFKNGNFTSIVKNAKFVIVIDFTTVILDCYLLKKPVISLPVKPKFGIPSALKNNSCIYTNLDNLEKTILQLNQDDFYEKTIQKGLFSASNYLSFQNSGTKKLSEFLEKFTIIDKNEN